MGLHPPSEAVTHPPAEAVRLMRLAALLHSDDANLQMAYGVDELFAYYQLLNGRAPHVRRRRVQPTAIVTPYPRCSGILLDIRHLKKLQALSGYAYHEVRTAVGQRVGLSKDGYKAPLYIELTSPCREDVCKSVQAIASWHDLFEVRCDGH